jgi:protein TonB
MTQLEYNTGSFRGSRARAAHTPQQRLFGVVFAVAMETAIVYALLVTLGYVEAPKIRPPMTVVNVAPVPDNPEVPPPPQQIFEAPQVEVITPVVELTYVPPPSISAISVPPPLPVPATPPRVVQPPAPMVFTPARAIAASHTIPEYPFVSRRLREQGTLRLKLTVDDKGVVTEAVVVNSSGFERLDEAAVSWVKSHWRYVPATRTRRWRRWRKPLSSSGCNSSLKSPPDKLSPVGAPT